MEEDKKTKCRKLLQNFGALKSKEKRDFISLFSSLIEENKEEAKQLYFDFEHLFDSVTALEVSKQELEEVCGELKNPDVTPVLSKSVCEGLVSKMETTELNECEKKEFSKYFENLLKEKDISYAKGLYKDHARLFLEKDYLGGLGKKFLERYKNTLPKEKEWEYKDFYKSFVATAIKDILEEYLSSKEQNNSKEHKMIDLFDDLCTNTPDIAYEFSTGNIISEKIEKNPILKGVRDKHWQKLKEAREQFNLDGNNIDKTIKEEIGNKTYYQRKIDFLNTFEEEQAVNLLILGETGSGKTTLINSMTNYLTGIQYDDKVRLKLIKEKIKSQSKSQTEEITMYAIKPKENIFNKPIRFIDTPGFGDTEGIKRDEFITSLFEGFIKTKCPRLNGICFVMKSSNNRVTPTQKYIINKVLSLFGKDTKENFFGLFTFADSSTPEVIEAIKTENIPISEENMFPFNNSGILPKGETKNNYSPEIEKQFFDLGYQSFKQFFDRIKQVTPADLNQTKDVIKSRREIENRLENLLLNINNALSRQRAIESQLKVYKENRENILANEDFEYEVEEAYEDREEVKQGTYVTVCPKCKYYLCHNDCSYADNDDKWLCYSMNHKGAFGNYMSTVRSKGKYFLYCGDTPLIDPSKSKKGPESWTAFDSEANMRYEQAKIEGKVKEVTEKMLEKVTCKSCKGKCSWKDHRNLGYYYVTRTRKVKKEYKHKKDKLIEGQNKEKQLEEILKKMEHEISQLGNDIKVDREEIKKNLRILDEIALRPEKRDDKSVVMDYYEIQLNMAIKENNEKRKEDLRKIIEKEREFIKIKNKGTDSYSSEKTEELVGELRRTLGQDKNQEKTDKLRSDSYSSIKTEELMNELRRTLGQDKNQEKN